MKNKSHQYTHANIGAELRRCIPKTAALRKKTQKIIFRNFWKIYMDNINFALRESVRIRSYSSPYVPATWTEYVEIWSISPYSVLMRENTDTFYAVLVMLQTFLLHLLFNEFDHRFYSQIHRRTTFHEPRR